MVFNSAWWTLYDTSGISIHRTINSDDYTGYKNLVINNISHDNGNTQPYYNFDNGGGIPTDGNGIIVDQNQRTNDGKPYVGRTLIEGNIVYNNGGSGMHAYESAHVDMVDNTAYMNNNCPVSGSTCGNINEGQIFGSASSDMNIYNNIMYAPAGKWAYSQWDDTNVSEDHNIMYDLGGKVFIKNHALSAHDIMADPQFSDVQLVSAFSSSPAIDAYDVANPRVPTWAFRLDRASPGFNAGTRTLDNGSPIPVNTLDGNLAPIPVIGALSDPSSR